MPASQAQVRTERASRYLAQLCNHGSHLSRLAVHRSSGHGDGAGPPTARSEHSETDGLIDFGWGRCTLHATSEALTLTAEAEDPQNLLRIQDGVGGRLQRVGRRDRLTVTWQQIQPGAAPVESDDEH